MENYLSTARVLTDELALELVLLEPKDVPGWASVMNQLDELADLSKNDGNDSLSDLAKGIKSIVEELVLGELASPEQGIKQEADPPPRLALKTPARQQS